MTSFELKLAERITTKSDHECVLLIAADEDDATRVLGELGSITEERFQVEWVTELSGGIERLLAGGVGATVLDLNLTGSQVFETLNRIFRAAPGVPVLILGQADTESLARQAVQHGAQDYLLREQSDGYRLRRAVRAMMVGRTADAVALENEIANATLDSIGEAVLRTDNIGNISYLNRFAEKMTGWSRVEALRRPIADVLLLIDSVSGAAVDNGVATVLQRDRTPAATIIHCTLVRRDGVEREIEGRVAIVQGNAGNLIGAVMTIRDVTVARAASLAVSRAAQHDALTNLPNRALFNDRLTQAISLAGRQRKQLAVLFVDLDQFKRVNDSLGHAVGDKLLRSVAGRLMACVRRSDTVCRLGGDEFVILLSQVEHAEDAAVSAQKILRAIASPHIIDNRSLDISVSIGGSTYPGDGQDAESLISQADAAMYEAKQHGRNGYQFFQSDMRTRVAKRLLLERDLRYAMGRNEFLLHYQPQINLQTGRITGMEALIRWLPRARDAISGGLCTHRGRMRFDFAHRTMGAIGSVQTIASMEGFGYRHCAGRSERFRSRISGQGFSIGSSGRIDRHRNRAAQLRAGTYRECFDAGRRVGRSHTTSAESYGRGPGHRRLRHWLFQLYLSTALPGGHAENPPIVCAGDLG